MDLARPIFREDQTAASTSDRSSRKPAAARTRVVVVTPASLSSPRLRLAIPYRAILSYWLDNHMFVASTLIGFTVMQRYPKMKVVVAHGKASWMEEVLEKMEASSRTIPLLHYYPVRTDTEELWEEGNVMLGFDAEERLIQKLPHDFAEKVVWGSRYPHQDTTSARDAIEEMTEANHAEDATIARMRAATPRNNSVSIWRGR